MNIIIKGARENNLKNVNLELPKNKLIVFTGLSGSGKSTLALETLQRECQRQYMESMGMTMEVGTKPMVDSIEGLSPAISINQSNANRNPRSNVGTVTEIAPYLRVIFSKLGQRLCSHCEKLVTQNYSEESETVFAELPDQSEEIAELFEEMIPCPHCGKNIIELSASHFSFNKPSGACSTCKGIGIVSLPDINLLVDKNKSIKEFAVQGWDQAYVDRYGASLVNAAKHYGFDLDIDAPVSEYGVVQMDLLLYGVLSKQFSKHFPGVKPPKTVPDGRFEGVVVNLMRRYEEKNSYSSKQKLEKFLIQQECPDCHGVRFRRETLEVTVGGKNIMDILAMPLTEVVNWLGELTSRLSEEAMIVVHQVLEDLIKRIDRIINVGGGYLCLNQPSSSLSPGEVQRIKLASILGSNLTGVLYILDEPSTGLHGRDTQKVIDSLYKLREMGNTVIVIEHDLEIMQAADYIVDFGPEAGRKGGQIVATGSVSEIASCTNSITGQYLSGNMYAPKRKKASGNGKILSIKGANTNNLKDLNLEIPLGQFITITGVSGAGKSSLVFGEIGNAATVYFNQSNSNAQEHISGFEALDAVITIDQSPIGRSARSNAATYTDIFTGIRNLFAELSVKQKSNLQARHFSYNVPGGRCEKCQGSGKIPISMNFLPDVEVTCPVCRGKRYQKPALAIKYKDHTIADVLDLSIDEAVILFESEKELYRKLTILQDVGLGYLGLGQSASTLSGGEAQRLKLAKELSKHSSNKTLYLFDEPTSGLHPYDANRLIHVFDSLVTQGNSVIMIEHNSEVILASDWVIDLGPEGGKHGGEIIAQGTPKEIVNIKNSATGELLAKILCEQDER